MSLTQDKVTKFIHAIAERYSIPVNDLFDLLPSPSSSSLDSHPTPIYEKMTAVELKKLCKEKGLKVSGTKADLIQRLKDPTPLVTNSKKKKNEVPLIHKKILHNAKTINVKRNQFGRYEDPSTNFVFSDTTMKVIGKQLEDGTVGELSEEDLLLCDQMLLEVQKL